MEEKLWNVSSSPHVRDHSSTQSIMRDVVIALLPATIIGIYNFRLSAVLVILTCCVSCMLAEYIWQRLMKQKVTTNDFSALLTGLLLALNLPATMGNPKVACLQLIRPVVDIQLDTPFCTDSNKDTVQPDRIITIRNPVQTVDYRKVIVYIIKDMLTLLKVFYIYCHNVLFFHNLSFFTFCKVGK